MYVVLYFRTEVTEVTHMYIMEAKLPFFFFTILKMVFTATLRSISFRLYFT